MLSSYPYNNTDNDNDYRDNYREGKTYAYLLTLVKLIGHGGKGFFHNGNLFRLCIGVCIEEGERNLSIAVV